MEWFLLAMQAFVYICAIFAFLCVLMQFISEWRGNQTNSKGTIKTNEQPKHFTKRRR